MNNYSAISVISDGSGSQYVLTVKNDTVRCRVFFDNSGKVGHESSFQVPNVVAIAGSTISGEARFYCFCLTSNDDVIMAYSDDCGETWEFAEKTW